MEVTAAAWSQKPNGEIILTPTDDLICFPGMLSIPAEGEGRIRVGMTVPPGAAEKTYRLNLEELPGVPRAEAVNEIRVLTTQSIPIFLRPGATTAGGRIDVSAFAGGVLSFTVSNTGTRHFIARTIRVTGFDPDERQLFSRSMNGWYILAGGVRDYEFTTEKSECTGTRRLLIEVETSDRALKEDFNLPPGGCDAIARPVTPNGSTEPAPVSAKRQP